MSETAAVSGLYNTTVTANQLFIKASQYFFISCEVQVYILISYQYAKLKFHISKHNCYSLGVEGRHRSRKNTWRGSCCSVSLLEIGQGLSLSKNQLKLLQKMLEYCMVTEKIVKKFYTKSKLAPSKLSTKLHTCLDLQRKQALFTYSTYVTVLN